jgi:hypothetical protein
MAFRSGQQKLLAVERIFLSLVLTAPIYSLLSILLRLLTLLILPRVGALFGPPPANSHNRLAA